MALANTRTFPNHSLQTQQPIEFLTENDFSIIRLSDIDESIPASGTSHQFLTRDPHGYELQITVLIADAARDEILRRCRGRISSDSSFWITIAERHLADYLWETEDYPPDATLVVEQLNLDDLDAARRWGCK